MSTFRVQKNKNHPYTTIDNTSINDKRLTPKAKGILLYLISKPDNWYINLPNLVSAFAGGKWSIRSGIKELIKFGYIIRSQARKENGRFSHYDYLVFEQPIKSPLPPVAFPPEYGNRTSGNRTCGNHTLLSTDNKESTKRKKMVVASEVLPDNVSATVIEYQNKKTAVTQLLTEMNIDDIEKIIKEFPLDLIFKYATLLKKKIEPMKKPGGYLITALRRKYLDDIEETPEHKNDKYYQHKCPECHKFFSSTNKLYDNALCLHCFAKRKDEHIKNIKSSKKRSS